MVHVIPPWKRSKGKELEDYHGSDEHDSWQFQIGSQLLRFWPEPFRRQASSGLAVRDKSTRFWSFGIAYNWGTRVRNGANLTPEYISRMSN